MSRGEKARADPKRIANLPRGENHWNYSATPTVLALHKRLYRKYGKAAEQICVDCGKQARDWSLKSGHEYSDRREDYDPRCKSCHVKYDDPDTNRPMLVSIGLKKAYAEGRR